MCGLRRDERGSGNGVARIGIYSSGEFIGANLVGRSRCWKNARVIDGCCVFRWFTLEWENGGRRLRTRVTETDGRVARLAANFLFKRKKKWRKMDFISLTKEESRRLVLCTGCQEIICHDLHSVILHLLIGEDLIF